MNTRIFKIVLMGQATVGKTSITLRIMHDTFMNCTDSTIGASYFIKKEPGISYEIWDTAGQERYWSLSKLYYRKANIILFVFDCSNIESIVTMKRFVDEVDKNIDIDDNKKFMFIGNKYDLIDNHEVLKKVFNELFVDRYSFDDVIFTSAKDNHNIDYLFKRIRDECLILEPDIIKRYIEIDEPNKYYWYSYCTIL